MPLESWQTRSFFIELKPRTEFASFFLDCPPANTTTLCEEASKNGTVITSEEASTSKLNNELSSVQNELVNIREHSIELRAAPEGDDINSVAFFAKLADITLYPNTVCAVTWADNHRLFMCKLQAKIGESSLPPKTFHRLAVNIISDVILEEYADQFRTYPIIAKCAECSATLLKHDDTNLDVYPVDEDDSLNVSQSMEYFCHDTCGASHSCGYQASCATYPSSMSDMKKWLPNEERITISDSYVLVLRKMIAQGAVTSDKSSEVIYCAKCSTELGVLYRRNNDIIQFHHAVFNFVADKQKETYINSRFGTLECFFAWLLLYKCESEASLKLVFRSYSKRPHILIWLLDSYVVVSQGKLCSTDEAAKNDKSVKSFPALKMLYKVFDADSARIDPRANGEDASVCFVDLPVMCCLKLIEILLLSSMALPPAARKVGQFYVGLLEMKNAVELRTL